MTNNKKGKSTKHIDRDEKKSSENGSKRINVSDVFLDELTGAFTKFDKIPESKRIELYGDQKYLDQFWEYFKREYPNFLDKIDQKDLPLYLETIEDKGFTVAHITEHAHRFTQEFGPEDTEQHVMQESLSQLQKFCEDTINAVPDGTFRKFADVAGFAHDTFQISFDGRLKTIGDLVSVWKKFVEKEHIVLGPTSAQHIENILTPKYNPTERAMVTVALSKIRKELTGTLRKAFDTQFPLPIHIFSSYQNLLVFRDERAQFLDDHAAEIDESLTKRLDSVIVTNGDIRKELFKSLENFNDTKGFPQQEQYFRRIFNKFVVRQLFEKAQTHQNTIDHYLASIGDTFKEFPPYVNDILRIYPFNEKNISSVDMSFYDDLKHIDTQIVELSDNFNSAPEEQKKELRTKIKALKEKREYRRWQAYISFLATKDSALADVFARLVKGKFDFSLLSADQQQLLLDVLIKNKLEESIKNKVPELLDVQEEQLIQFVHDLFDLKKMDISIPTRFGPVSLKFLKKEFLSIVHNRIPAISDLEDIRNLPLNFLVQLTENNAAFFEDSPIFDSLYTDFVAQNDRFRLHDAYKVRITKNGKTVEGYLSVYCPIDETYNDKGYTGGEMFLYSHPITSPYQDRELVTWPQEEGKRSLPVVIKKEEQQTYKMDVLEKQINLNGEAFGALLFGYVLGQQSKHTSLSSQQERELAQKFGEIETYKDKSRLSDQEEVVSEPSPETKGESVSEYTKLENERKNLKGYAFSEEKYKDTAGFVPGSVLCIPFADSEVPPVGTGRAWLKMEITHIDTKKGTWKVKIHGGELKLGGSEGATKELPLHVSALESIKKAFGSDIYKLPETKHASFSHALDILSSSSLGDGLHSHFGSLKYDGTKFVYSLGNYTGSEITHFGIYEPMPIDEDVATDTGNLILYKIKPNANGTITVSGDSTENNYAKNFPARDMDYPTFMLFVKEKGLQPKCKEQVDALHAQVPPKSRKETPTTIRGFSINSVMGFFKNSFGKLKDSIKKYDEELTEDLTDLLTQKGQLWNGLGSLLSPFGRISASFENMGMEYFLERDNRVWKKVEKWVNFYEKDFDYTKIYFMYIKPMLDGTKKIVPHYKIAALLLVHLKKGKGPYAKDPTSSARGDWVAALLGKDHQKRYLDIREKRIRDLEENADAYGGPWADQVKNELVELEMRYIVHVMDGRHMGMGDPTKYYFQEKYSKKFCEELESTYTGFFKQSTVEEGFTKVQDANFEFARVEYFRQLADRPQQALPYLKVMATKAINDTQWQVFEHAVLVGMLSGVFLNMTYSSTQSFVEKICRTRGFVPGLFVKDIKQQSKIQRLLDIFSGGTFTKETSYDPTNLSFRKNDGSIAFINSFKGWMAKGSTRSRLSSFFDLTGKNIEGKTLLDVYSDPALSLSDKLLLEEYILKSNEKHEDLDNEVEKNRSSLTGSILTKSQSVVERMIKIDQYGFAGKDGDEKQNMEAFSKKMKEAIPTETQSSEQKVKFFVEKFFNRFSAFSGSKKTDLLKRLLWCRDHPSSPDVQNILYYGIVGEIINSIATRDAQLPEELEGALNAWKIFFENNLTMILRPDVVASTFGNQYAGDLLSFSKHKPELYPREDASLLLDRQDSNMYITTLPTNEQKTQARLKRQELKRPDGKYINGPLFDLADQLSRKCSQFSSNRFKNIGKPRPSATAMPLGHKNTGARIKNPETIEQVKQILEGKQVEENDSSYIGWEDDDYTDYDD